jgi:hypothetical protein
LGDVLALVSMKQLKGQEFVILQAVSGYIYYVGDRNLSCMTVSIRLAGFYCAVSEISTCRLGSQLKINFEHLNFWFVRIKDIFVY